MHNVCKIFTLLLFISGYSFSQNGNVPVTEGNVRYVDFHIHTTMKNYYRDVPHPDSINKSTQFFQQNCLDTANWNGTHHKKKKIRYSGKFTGFYGCDSYPQASYDLLNKSGASILCTSITPMEKRNVSDRRITIIPYLRVGLPMRSINKLFVTKLDCKRQKTVYDMPSFDEFMAEYKFMAGQKQEHPGFSRKVLLVKDHDELVKTLDEKNIALVLTLEGAHIFFGKNCKCGEHNFERGCGLNELSMDEVRENIRKVKNLPHRVFFVTTSHLSWNCISSNAKGLDVKSKILRALLYKNTQDRAFRSNVFKKYAGGIVDTITVYDRKNDALKKNNCNCKDSVLCMESGYGREVINRLLDTTGGFKPIYVDMRHMSVGARYEYMKLAEQYNHGDTIIPLIISHAAVNGKTLQQAWKFGSCPFADRYEEIICPKKFYKKFEQCLDSAKPRPIPHINLDTTGWFHPFSVNLYNEEIEAMYNSGGIIGITLEERVLGTGRYNYTRKHCKELKAFFEKELKYSSEKEFKEKYKKIKITEPFIRNLLYILEHSGYAGNIKSWEHIALGTDFDGMVDPLDVCMKTDEIPGFYKLLAELIPLFAKYTHKEYLLVNEKPEVLLNKLFYENGEKFILKYF